MNTGNEETVVTKAGGNHCDCEAEQMMTSVVCSSNYCLTASIGEESME
ncbi:hypothetical protein [Enterococcus gallinarum]